MSTVTAYLLFFSSFITGYFCAACDGSLFYALFGERYSYTTEKIMQIDSTSGNVSAVYNTTLNTTEYSGFLGSAVHPTTGEVYVVVLNARGYNDGGYPRALARLSIPDGNVEVIGSLGTATDYLSIADLAFDCEGTLYAISGDKREVGLMSLHYLNTSSSIFSVDMNTAETHFITSRYNGSLNVNGTTAKVYAGEVITFNYDNGLIYRFSGKVGGHVFESISIEMNTIDNSYIVEVTNIDIIDVHDALLDIKQIMALEYIGGDIFVGFGVDRKLFSMTVHGYIFDSMEFGTNFAFVADFYRYNIPRAIVVTDGVENNICYHLCPTQEPTKSPTDVSAMNTTNVDATSMINIKISMFFIICSLGYRLLF